MREVKEIIQGLPASDGDGVKLTRVIGTPKLDMLDPFLMLDAFGSDSPQDYLGGFPAHPHRGFETVTYILNGRMRHKDNAGHEGVIEEGDVQWMSAGRGIIHSEMPEQEQGLLKGFQLWINLPATQKMSEPRYQEYVSKDLPIEANKAGSRIKVIAGKTDKNTKGPIEAEATAPIYFDINLKAGDNFTQSIPKGHNSALYNIEGDLYVGARETLVGQDQLAILEDGDTVSIKTMGQDARFLLLAGKPLNEPVARGGPFVMNTKAEILQAFQDYNDGKF
ncbi:pirin family protein [Curvivirga aplysinae]|uniref:pirin family protein n=1 Tax=Curvivirga aplysinae TaxID=2529852 RepID=UPI0012BD06FA|nr:pirin family protein [Curvivirga aplysinae]MTI10801.1 pirin family protein [Curvivirga aplysinae]